MLYYRFKRAFVTHWIGVRWVLDVEIGYKLFETTFRLIETKEFDVTLHPPLLFKFFLVFSLSIQSINSEFIITFTITFILCDKRPVQIS